MANLISIEPYHGGWLISVDHCDLVVFRTFEEARAMSIAMDAQCLVEVCNEQGKPVQILRQPSDPKF